VKSLATMMSGCNKCEQTKLRIFCRVTKSQEKIVSVFESHTEYHSQGKASKPTEFGKLVKIQESEIKSSAIRSLCRTAQRPAVLVPSIEVHSEIAGFGLVPLMRGSLAQNETLPVHGSAMVSVRIRRRRVRPQTTLSQRWFRRGNGGGRM